MIQGARYVHTNLIAHDWRRLAAFYVDLFGCTIVPPERNYSGADLEAGTGVPGASLAGVHLRLPGHGVDGPTLEIFGYSCLVDGYAPAVNRPGLAHLAFQVDSVVEARREVLAAGGKAVGEVVTLTTASGLRVTWWLPISRATYWSSNPGYKWQISPPDEPPTTASRCDQAFVLHLDQKNP